jgi:hypothetical protein
LASTEDEVAVPEAQAVSEIATAATSATPAK